MRFLLLTKTLTLGLLIGSAEARLGITRENKAPQQQQQQLPQAHVHIRKLQGDLGELEGLGGNPSSFHFPLQLCEGDCDYDTDCDVGLVCFQRDPGMAVPGCIGGEDERSRTDFCVPDPNFGGLSGAQTGSPAGTTTSPPTPPPAIPNTSQPTPAPANPITSQPTTSPTPAPETPVATTEESDGTPQLPELEKVGNNGVPSWRYPLGECLGDCDDDTECQEGLICFHRDGGEPVPGCIGDDQSRNDYCIKDPSIPTASPTTAPTSTPTTQFPSASPTIDDTPSPTASNPPSQSPSISSVPTASPSDFPSNVPSDLPSQVPTLSTSPSVSNAPTIPPSSSPTMEPITGVRLKLYWEEGYTWQDETIERKWCMISDYRGFPGTGKCWHGLHTEPCHADMVYVARCDYDKRQTFSIIPMPGGSQYQISVHEENLCLARSEYSIVLQECNHLNPLQRFWMPRGAAFTKRFELSPITLANHCLTQAHHPKSGEVIELHKCSRARHIDHQSSFWSVY